MGINTRHIGETHWVKIGHYIKTYIRRDSLEKIELDVFIQI